MNELQHIQNLFFGFDRFALLDREGFRGMHSMKMGRFSLTLFRVVLVPILVFTTLFPVSSSGSTAQGCQVTVPCFKFLIPPVTLSWKLLFSSSTTFHFVLHTRYHIMSVRPGGHTSKRGRGAKTSLERG